MESQSWRKEPRKNYSNDFKTRIVELTSRPGACVAQIARENGINDNHHDEVSLSAKRQLLKEAHLTSSRQQTDSKHTKSVADIKYRHKIQAIDTDWLLSILLISGQWRFIKLKGNWHHE